MGDEEKDQEVRLRVARPPGAVPPTKLVSRKSAGLQPQKQLASSRVAVTPSKQASVPDNHSAEGIVWCKVGDEQSRTGLRDR